MREEHVDGGYLVTQGVYVGPEDFNKAVVRQLMVCFIFFLLNMTLSTIILSSIRGKINS